MTSRNGLIELHSFKIDKDEKDSEHPSVAESEPPFSGRGRSKVGSDSGSSLSL